MDSNFGKYLKLTKSKIFVKTGDNSWVLWSIFDNKKLILDEDDIEVLRRRIVEGVIEFQYAERMVDAALKRYVVKHCTDKDYYAVADKRNFMFIMGLKRETIFKIVEYFNNLS